MLFCLLRKFSKLIFFQPKGIELISTQIRFFFRFNEDDAGNFELKDKVNADLEEVNEELTAMTTLGK